MFVFCKNKRDLKIFFLVGLDFNMCVIHIVFLQEINFTETRRNLNAMVVCIKQYFVQNVVIINIIYLFRFI